MRSANNISEDVYTIMQGPEWNVTGNHKNWDVTERLAELALPALVTSGRYAPRRSWPCWTVLRRCRRRSGRCSTPGDRPLPAAQDPQRPRSSTGEATQPGRPADAHCLPHGLRPGCPGQLEALAVELDKTHPGAAASLREGMAETLTVLRLGVPPTLARTLRSTNAVESMISISRDHSRNVKRWRDGQMALRWCAAGVVEAGKQFRRVNGHLHLPALRTALARQVGAETVTNTCDDQEMNAA
jgi:hypothetical protein